MKKILKQGYADIVSLENLLEAWQEFSIGKRARKDVHAFELRLMEHLISLHTELITKSYRHGSYEAFKVNDPKPRDIHKASARDRIVHRALYRILSPFFDTVFIADSYSCRNAKGTHKAIRKFHEFSRKVSRNRTKTVWVLKCDIRKFFASIDHRVLLGILKERIRDPDIVWLLEEVIGSFHSPCHLGFPPEPLRGAIRAGDPESNDSGLPRYARNDREESLVVRKGLPLGNLTSQLFANIYLNELDQFVKHGLKAKRYIRYADDFALLSTQYEELEGSLISIKEFLEERLDLRLHPNKVSIGTVASGVDFLGWVHFPDHRVLRTATKKRMFRKLDEKNIFSYLGLLGAGNERKLGMKIQKHSEGTP
jgi:RNA-directed DNA polymerase